MAVTFDWHNSTPDLRDALIASAVMQWKPEECQGEMWECGTYWRCSNCSLTGDWTHANSDSFISHIAQCPRYTSNIADTWLVVEHFTVPDVSAVTITHIPLAQHWQVEIHFANGWRSEAHGATAMETIGIASLRAKGITVQQ